MIPSGIAVYRGKYGQDLARILNLPSWVPYKQKRRIRGRKNRLVDENGNPVIINYGCRQDVFENLPENVIVVNKHAQNAWSKLESFKMWDAFERYIPHPELVEAGDTRGIRFARKDRLSQGRGVTVLLDGDAVTQEIKYDFIVRYVPIVREFRVHVFSGKFVLAAEKLRVGGAGLLGNFHQGAVVFRQVFKDDLPKGVWLYSARAIRALKLDWGAVDVGVTEEGKVVIFEANTAPAILNLPLYRYAKMIASHYCPDYVLPEYKPYGE